MNYGARDGGRGTSHDNTGERGEREGGEGRERGEGKIVKKGKGRRFKGRSSSESAGKRELIKVRSERWSLVPSPMCRDWRATRSGGGVWLW